MARALFHAAVLTAATLVGGAASAAPQYAAPHPATPQYQPAVPRFQAPAPQQPAAQPDGPDFTPEQMQQGVIQLSSQQCAVYALTVYVQSHGVGVCFRYYISSAGGNADEAVYWLSGDKSGERLAYDPAVLERQAVQMSQRYRRPAVYLARIGLDGSSGWHLGWRRSLFEVEATSRAIDAINARYGFRAVHVMGQSGGGHLTGALIGLRRDIGCAVPGAGPLAFRTRHNQLLLRFQPRPHHYDPATRIREAAAQSRVTRVLVVTSPGDQVVPMHTQTDFVQRVRELGGNASQFFVRALDERGHAATPFTREAMAGCLAGANDAAIEASLQRLGAFMLARQTAQQIGQQPPTNYREAVQPIQVPPAGAPRLAAPAATAPTAPGYAAPRGLVSTMPPPPPPGAGMQRYYR